MRIWKRKPDLEEILTRLDDLYEEGDEVRARKELARARRQYPDSLDLKEWEARLAIDEGRFQEALGELEAVLAADPGRPFALRERASVLVDLGRFAEALSLLEDLRDRRDAGDDPVETASIHHEIGLCIDREGRASEADAEFRKAARLAPEDFPAPPRMTLKQFDALVRDALRSIPEAFQPYLRQVALTVQDYPSPKEDDPFLLGLYVGLPRTERSWDSAEPLEGIFIFKRNHELAHAEPEELKEEVRKTIVHEIAHHFGLDEGDMGDYA